ncbi:MAG: C1 family peptidase [Pirellulales bacterium]|nr:C1 family peptidase [Pirellulales bacterium]
MRNSFRSAAFCSAVFSIAAFTCLHPITNAQASDPTPSGKKTAALPANVDLRPEFKKFGFEPKRQGKRGTCSVFTVTSAMEFAIAKRLGKSAPLSVEYLNWAANQVIHYHADGQFFHNLLKGYERYGICREALMPYRKKFDPALAPSEEARSDAKKIGSVPVAISWIKPWGRKAGLTDEQMNQIKERLVQGWPVAAGAGHSRLLVGYRDDSERPGGGLFVTKDSGKGAYAEVTYEWAKAHLVDVFWIESNPKKTESR